MERFTVSIDPPLAEAFDQWLQERGYSNRSEGFRDLLRTELERRRQGSGRSRHCVASLSFVYNHHERDLAGRLAELQHAHHPVVVASTHVHLDHDQCLETVILRGPTVEVKAFADAVCAQRGVRHGALNLISARVTTSHKSHGHAHARSAPHVHVTPAD